MFLSVLDGRGLSMHKMRQPLSLSQETAHAQHMLSNAFLCKDIQLSQIPCFAFRATVVFSIFVTDNKSFFILLSFGYVYLYCKN